MPKIAWAKQLFNAYNTIKKGETVYDKNGGVIGVSDGCYARPTNNSPGSVCLVKRGKFVWISGDVEKTEKGWNTTDTCSVS